MVKTQQPLLKHFSSINLYFTYKSNFPIKEQNCCAYTNQVLSNLRKIHLNNFFFQFLALCSPFLFLMMGDYCNCVFYFVILLHKILCKQSNRSSCHNFRQLNKEVRFFLLLFYIYIENSYIYIYYIYIYHIIKKSCTYA